MCQIVMTRESLTVLCVEVIIVAKRWQVFLEELSKAFDWSFGIEFTGVDMRLAVG